MNRTSFRLCRLAVAVALTLLPHILSALVMDARPGFNGFFVAGRWTPVLVTVENLQRGDKARETVREFTGTCEVRSGVFNGSSEMVFSRNLEVPVGDRKRFIVYTTMAPGLLELQVDLLDKNGKQIATVRKPVKQVADNQRFAAYVNLTGSAFMAPMVPDIPNCVLAPVEPEDLPDRWYGYDSLSTLIIPRVTDQLLDREKSAALEQWIRQGGEVLFLSGRYGQSYRGSSIEKILPGTYKSNSAYRWESGKLVPFASTGTDNGTGSLVVTEVEPATDSVVLYSVNDVPLLLSRNLGSGRVLFLATDWPPRMVPEHPLARLLGMHLQVRHDLQRASARYNNEFFLRNFGIYELGTAALLPNTYLVFFLLVSYLIFVGPLNFYILFRKKKLELAWVTVPAVVIIYTLGIYFLSSALKGQESHLRTYNMLRGKCGSDDYRCESVSMTFLPNPGTHSIGMDDLYAAASQHEVWNSQRLLNIPTAMPGKPVTIDESSRGMQLPQKYFRQWDTDFTRFDSLQSIGAIESNVLLDAGHLRGTITNSTKAVIADLGLAIDAKVFEPGKTKQLAPGERVEFDIPLELVTGRVGTWAPRSGNATEDLVSTVFKDVIIDVRSRDLPPCVLIGRYDGELPEPRISTGISTRKQYTMFALEVPVKTTPQSEAVLPQGANLLEVKGLNLFSNSELMNPLSLDGATYSIRPESVFNGASAGLFFAHTPRAADDRIVCDYFDWKEWAWREVGLRKEMVQTVLDAEHNNDTGLLEMQFENASTAVHPFSNEMLIKLRKRGGAFGDPNVSVAPPSLVPKGSGIQ